MHYLSYLIFTTVQIQHLSDCYSHTQTSVTRLNTLNFFPVISCLTYFQTAGTIIVVGNFDAVISITDVFPSTCVWVIYLLPSSICFLHFDTITLFTRARTHTRTHVPFSLLLYCYETWKSVIFLNLKPFFISLFYFILILNRS